MCLNSILCILGSSGSALFCWSFTKFDKITKPKPLDLAESRMYFFPIDLAKYVEWKWGACPWEWSEMVNQLTIACCQGRLCDCESLIRLYEARFIVWPPFAQHCQIWNLQSNPPLISGCSVISHRQYVLKSNEEDTSSQSYKIREITPDSTAQQSRKERLIIFIPLSYFLTVCCTSVFVSHQ